MTTGIHLLAEQIGNLYLNEKGSDFRITIGDETLPAHRLILIQRCPYFERMFDADMKESRTGQMQVQETPIPAFKSVLKWIYTGCIVLTDFETDIEVLQVAHLYELTDLMHTVIEHIKAVYTPDDAWLLLEQAALLSLPELKEFVDDICQPDTNVAVPNFGVNVISGGDTAFFPKRELGDFLKHKIESSDESIVIDLGHRFKLNHLKMQLDCPDGGNYSYWIAVSTDNVKWTRVIDHSKYTCRGLQKLYFNERIVRYIRICGTASETNTFEISLLEAYYTSEPFTVDVGTTLLIPKNNVALAEKHAKVIQGSNASENAIIDGNFERFTYSDSTGYTWHDAEVDGIIVQLPQPYLLNSIKLLLWDHDDRVYSYYVEVSSDNDNWTLVAREENVRSWCLLQFDLQPAVFVKITGICNCVNSSFRVVYLECSATVSNIDT